MPRTSTTLTRGALRVAAALLLVDGRALRPAELARVALPWGGQISVVSDWMVALRRAGCRIETLDFRGSGYRLLEIPPDAVLDDVLTHARELRTEHPTRLWDLFGRAVATSPSRETRSSASSARRSA
jgi:hypothetical protein